MIRGMWVVVCAHLGLAAIDLPKLWRAQLRREFWTTAILLLLSLTLALVFVTNHLPRSPVTLINHLFSPVGSVLFAPKQP